MGRPSINEVGNRYGKLVVVKPSTKIPDREVRWVCLCDCGNYRVVRGSRLRVGDINSCGCVKRDRVLGMNSINEIGNVYGLLTVIGRDENRRRIDYSGRIIRTESMWVCQCSCGNVVKVLGRLLRSDNTRSCGCGGLNSTDAAFNGLYLRMKRSADDREYSWNLNKEQVKALTSLPCYYCGISPSQIARNRGRQDYIYNGIDRIDNTIGYEINNCVPCCKVCNSAKNVFSLNEFMNWIEIVYHKLFKS